METIHKRGELEQDALRTTTTRLWIRPPNYRSRFRFEPQSVSHSAQRVSDSIHAIHASQFERSKQTSDGYRISTSSNREICVRWNSSTHARNAPTETTITLDLIASSEKQLRPTDWGRYASNESAVRHPSDAEFGRNLNAGSHRRKVENLSSIHRSSANRLRFFLKRCHSAICSRDESTTHGRGPLFWISTYCVKSSVGSLSSHAARSCEHAHERPHAGSHLPMP